MPAKEIKSRKSIHVWFHRKYLNVFSHLTETKNAPHSRILRPLLAPRFWDTWTAISGRGYSPLGRKEIIPATQAKKTEKLYAYQKAKAGILDYLMCHIPALVVLIMLGLWNLLKTMPSGAKFALGPVILPLLIASFFLHVALSLFKQIVGFFLAVCALPFILPIHAIIAHNTQEDWNRLQTNFQSQKWRIHKGILSNEKELQPIFLEKDFNDLLSEQDKRKKIEERFDLEIEDLVETKPELLRSQRIQFTLDKDPKKDSQSFCYSLSISKKQGKMEDPTNVILNQGDNKIINSEEEKKINELYLRFNFADAARQRVQSANEFNEDKKSLIY